MAENKRQHYVHQAYLRNFSPDEKQIFVFDKILTSAFDTGIRNVAQESYFYRLPKDLVDEEDNPIEIDVQFAEKWFQTLEDDANRYIERLSILTMGDLIPHDIREALAVWIAIQYLRTRTNRDTIINVTEGLASRISEELIKRKFGEDTVEYLPKVTYSEEAAKLFQIEQLLRPGLVEEFADILNGHVWSLQINNTPQPFYTSDTPVALHNHLPRPKFRPGKGLASKGIEINFPISSTRLIALTERGLFGDRAREFDNRVMFLNEQNVEFANSLQVIESERQLYCEKPSWELVEDMIRENPRLSGKRSRIGFS